MRKSLDGSNNMGERLGKLADAGSKRWLQLAVNTQPQLLDEPILRSMEVPGITTVEWVCPLDAHDYCEYRDNEALTRLGAPKLARRPLGDFWPQRGPVWDGLARAGEELLLVEAKANIPELASGCSKAEDERLDKINDALAEVRRFLAPRSKANWNQTFFQYANRLAMLYLLRHVNGLPAHLVFVYFLNAKDVKGPETIQEWQAALTLLYEVLELPRRHPLAPFVHSVFVDARPLAQAAV